MTARQQKVPAIFGRRVRCERKRHGWSMRELSIKADVSIATVHGAENGKDPALSSAIALAAALGLSLGTLLAEPECARCDGKPPAGFICSACGREGAT